VCASSTITTRATATRTPGATSTPSRSPPRSGVYRAAGCPGGAALEVPPGPITTATNHHSQCESPTASFDTNDGTTDNGYVSLGGSKLWCDVGVALRKHDHILIWEIHSVGGLHNDHFGVDICQTLSGPCLPSHLNRDTVISGDESDHADIDIDVEFLDSQIFYASDNRPYAGAPHLG